MCEENIMLKHTMSPQRYSADMDQFYDTNFTAEINAKMQVPKKIKVAGSSSDDDEPMINPWQPDKIDMRVPDRILVVGQNQHVGAEAPPRELLIENTIMPPDPGLIRVQTPPRVITLEEYFPVDDFYHPNTNNAENTLVMNNEKKETQGPMISNNYKAANQSLFMDNTTIDYSSQSEEFVHLRRQLAKLNRRVMNVEREMAHKQQRDRIIIAFATVYLFIRFYSWVNRN